MPILEVEHISKSFNKTPVLKDVGFNLEKGQAVSIIGSSGSGKTTLLRCLNFLEHPDNGIIRVNGETLFDASVPATTQESVMPPTLPPRRKARSAKSGSILVWCSRTLICFRSIPLWKM